MKWFAKNYYIEKSWLGNIECKFDGYNNFGNRRAANKWRLLMITQEENLKSIIEEIKNNKIMLPDFQRQFDWNIEKQIGLVASVQNYPLEEFCFWRRIQRIIKVKELD